jgi:hypothetical protein
MRNLFLALAIIMFMALAGCGPIHTGPQISHSKLDQLVIGKTTKSEVIALFGELPSTQSRTGSGLSTFTWIHTRRDYNAWLGVYLPAASDSVTVIFDKDDVVQDYSFAGMQNQREVTSGTEKPGTKPDLNVKQ